MKSTFQLQYGAAAAAFLPARYASDPILGTFWLVAGVIAIILSIYLFVQPTWRVGAGIAIAVVALLPSYIWCRQKASSIPILPLLAITYLGTYAYPLVSGHPIVLAYSEEAAILAGATVCGFLLIATGAWYLVIRSPSPAYARVRAMAPGEGDYLFIAILLAASLLNMAVVGVWFELPRGVFSIIRAALFGLSSVGIFMLGYRWGHGDLDTGKTCVFGFAFALYVLSHTMTLFLIGAIVATTLLLAAFVFGRRRIPWKWALVMFCIFAVLHTGKGEIRIRHWYPEPEPMQIWEYPELLTEWLGAGVEKLTSEGDDIDSQPLYERLSLVHLLLKIHQDSPDPVPYLYGASYAVIPYLIVPRIINPDKLSAHEGTTILSVHYGLQTREDTERTTIGWGLLNEAVANFGWLGALLLAVFTGLVYGYITRMSVGMPILSLPVLVAITFVAFAAQTEYTAGVYVSALIQSLVSLFAMSFVFMKPQLVLRSDTAHA